MNRRVFVLTVVALALLTVTTYLPALQNGFIWDDDAHVTNNANLRSVEGLKRIWFEPQASQQYYPLQLTTYWLEYRIWGQRPFGYHLVNILLHALNAVLVWQILKRLEVSGASVAAVIFAVHPVAVESVAWISERKNVLSGTFYLLAMQAYIRFQWSKTGLPDWRFYPLVMFLFLCALLSKTVTCSLPAALVLLTWWKRGHIKRVDVWALMPLFVLGAGLGLATAWLEKHHVGAGTDWSLSFIQRCLLASRALWFYAGKLVWPYPLNFVYPRWEIDACSGWQWLFPLATVAAISSLWTWRCRGALVAVLFFAGTLFPALGFFDVYPFRYTFVADHFQYLASVGIIALAAAAGATFVRPRAVQIGALMLALAGLGVLSWRHARVFYDDETLWRAALARNPDAFLAHNNLGTIYNSRKQHTLAAEQFRAALALKPEFFEAHSNLGFALTELGRYDEAEQHLLEAVRISPAYAYAQYWLGKLYQRMNRLEDAKVRYALAIQSDAGIAGAHNDLGTIWQQQGERTRAIACYRSALLLSSNYPAAHNNLANLLAEDGKLLEAIEHYRQALSGDPNLGQTHYNLGVNLAQLERTGEAIEHLRAANRLLPTAPDTYIQLAKALVQDRRFGQAIATLQTALTTAAPNPAIANEYAWLVATCPVAELRNAPQAIEIAEELVNVTGRQAALLDTLAAAYADAGRFDEAVATATEAAAVAEKNKQTELAAAIQSRRALYEKHQPYRLTPR